MKSGISDSTVHDVKGVTQAETQSPIWVNPMGPITLSFGKKCYNVTTPGDNLQISSTKRAFILTAQDQPGGRFKNTYELLNPRALKISML